MYIKLEASDKTEILKKISDLLENSYVFASIGNKNGLYYIDASTEQNEPEPNPI